jgi:hypothetical protein
MEHRGMLIIPRARRRSRGSYATGRYEWLLACPGLKISWA